jgi:predicted nucleic-acid-binding protein
MLETEWVLRSTYNYPAAQIEAAFRAVMGLSWVTVEDYDAVMQALDWFASGLDFADALHLASSRDSGRFVTLDRDLIRRARSLEDTPEVSAP